MNYSRLQVFPLLFVLAVLGCGRSSLRPDAGPAGDGAESTDGTLAGDGAVGDGTSPPVKFLGLDVSPALAKVAVGTSVAFTATGRFSDGSTQNLTAVAAWTSGQPTIASVSGGVAKGLSAGSTTIQATAMGISATASLTVTAATLTAISVDPANALIPVATKIGLTATGLFSDGSKQDLTRQVKWDSADATIAAVDAGGVVSGLRAGTTAITAALLGVTGKTAITITAATLKSIEVTPGNIKLPLPGSQQFTATGVFSNGTTGDLTGTAKWDSSDTSVLIISNAPGMYGQAQSVAAGTSVVTARQAGIAGIAVVTVLKATLVSIKVTPASASAPKGTTAAFRATGTYSDGSVVDITADVAWSPGDDKIVSVSNASGTEGLATGLGIGSTVVTASRAGISGTAKITVTAATVVSLSIAPAGASVAAGHKLQYAATATLSDNSKSDVTSSVAWSTADSSVASISNAQGSAGFLTARNVGGTTITATLAGAGGALGIGAATTITVTNATLDSIALAPASATIAAGQSQAFTATGVYSDGTKLDLTNQATWSSDDTAVATVSNAPGFRGRATGLAKGTAAIHARLGNVDGVAKLTVTAPTLTLLAVSPINPTRHAGESLQFGASAIASDGTSGNVTLQATWTSSDNNVATITSGAGNFSGRAICITTGTVTITASYMGLADSTRLTCTDAAMLSIQVTPFLADLLVGQRVGFTATAVFSDGSTRNVTQISDWASSNPAVASIGPMMGMGMGGRPVTALSDGTTTISATYMGFSAPAQVNVSSPALLSVSLSPVLATLRAGQDQQYQLTGIYSDGSARPITDMATWTSSDSTVAGIANNGMQRGRATALKPGTTTITGTYMGLSDSGTLTVGAAKLASLSVSPINPKVIVGQSLQFQAVAIFDDGSSSNVTGQALWTSSDSTIAAVSNAQGRGQATALRAGSAIIGAAYMGFSDSSFMTVVDAKIVRIDVTPTGASIPVGESVQYQAVAIYSDGTLQNVTQQAVWFSSDGTVADVANGQGRGRVTGLKVGLAQISAVMGGLTGIASVTVAAVKIIEIQVTPANPLILVSGVQQFTAIAVYSDFTTRNITGAATWSSSNTAVADVSNGFGSPGRTTGVGGGMAAISAVYMGSSGATIITVTPAKIKDIQITPANRVTPVGFFTQFLATALLTDGTTLDITTSATWESSDATVVLISNVAGSRGMAAALKPGSTAISATLAGISGTTVYTVGSEKLLSIDVQPQAFVAKGDRVQFAARGYYEGGLTYDLTTYVTWLSANNAIAAASNAAGSQGLVTAIASGTTRIEAHLGNKTGSVALTVTP